MGLSAFPLGDAVRVEVLEQTIAGGQPGVVIHGRRLRCGLGLYDTTVVRLLAWTT